MALRRCRCSPRHESPPRFWIGSKSSSVDRDHLNEHLKFAAELGVAGVSRDPAWRTRPADKLAPNSSPLDHARGDPEALEGSKGEPVTFSASAAEALAAVRADI